MNELAVIVVGIIVGLGLALLAASIASLTYVAWRQRELTIAATDRTIAAITKVAAIATNLQLTVTSSLAAIDANRLSDASLAIQHSSKSLNNTVAALNKVVFAAGFGDAGMNLPQNQYDDMQDVPPANNFVEYDVPGRRNSINMGHNVGYPPSQPSTMQPNDPFILWQQAQREKADALSGSSFPAATSSPLPDLETAFEADLADPEVMSDHDIAAIPGFTTADTRSPLLDLP